MACILLVPGFLPAQSHMVRYHPENGDIVITNGTHRFNRALYGTNTGFRVEAGDLPEFALYMPGMGGNLSFALISGATSTRLIDCRDIKAIYRPGSMIYEIRDPAIGSGSMTLTILALPDAEGLIIRIITANFDAIGRAHLISTFGGASGKKFSRDGDIGADPESSFYLDKTACRDNQYTVTANSFTLSYASAKKLEGVFPKRIDIGAGPILSSELPINDTCYLLIRNPASTQTPLPAYSVLPAIFHAAESSRQQLVNRVQLHTPDPYLNTLGGALAIAADGIWEAPSYMHGAVAWRQRLPAWRGPYVADPLGWHDRARQHFSSYALSQLTSPADGPVIADTTLHLARQLEKLGTSIFSSGYICRNPNGDFRPHHYDMNLVFIDQLLTHFYWTGDTAYVRTMWPVLKRHLAWEKRNFDPDGDGLYDAYACIWASDALEYSGGGVTHSSAYNYRANLLAADLARLIGEDPTPYQTEATHILHAIDKTLWMPAKGWYAEYIDPPASPPPAAPSNIHPAAGLWTIYHAIDSHVPNPFQAWQALHYIDTDIPHIPIHATGLADTTLFLLSTTNWQPYTWSLNNVALAESLHTALAYWQGNRPEAAYRLWKSALLESMYLGSSPGNFEQLSSYDAVRGELYRDFADPIGMAARSLVEGLFGIRPDALHDTLTITPGWPLEWQQASIHIPDITIGYTRNDQTDEYTIAPAFAKPLTLRLRLRARSTGIRTLTVNGRPIAWTNIDEAIGFPMLELLTAPAPSYHITITWNRSSAPIDTLASYDLQQALTHPTPGNKTVFVHLRQGPFRWWEPHCFNIPETTIATAKEPPGNADTISLHNYFNDIVTNIFKNQYRSPRPNTPTLQLPTQGIGNWCYPLATADIDDSGLRAANNQLSLPNHIPLATSGNGPNIIFTSRWDNYPDSVTIPLKGRASHAWFLLAGTTNPMQSRITNGIIAIHYTDGFTDTLKLVNPSTWWPIEEDYLENGLAFTTGAPHPTRVYLKTGIISDKPGKWTSIKGLTNTAIDGGAATVLDMPLHPHKTLDHLVIRATANDVVIGLMSLTLIKLAEK